MVAENPLQRSDNSLKINDLREISNRQTKAFWRLNQKYARQTSAFEFNEWCAHIEAAPVALCVEPSLGLLLAFDDSSDIPSPNFQWFKARYQDFYYVDRIIIAPDGQAQGLGSVLYECLEDLAIEAGKKSILAEVNTVPDNPISHAFHEKMGFEVVGEQDFGQKSVLYYAKTL